MRLEFGPEFCRDLERSSSLEWLESNGLGGWSFGTIAGVATRRYHGILSVAASPTDRRLLLSRLDETLIRGEERFELACRSFPGTVDPRGYEYLDRYRHDLFPTFTFTCGGVRIEKRIVALHGRNEVILHYRVLRHGTPDTHDLRDANITPDTHDRRDANVTPDTHDRRDTYGTPDTRDVTPLRLELRPFLAGRDIHALLRATDGTRFSAEQRDGALRIEIFSSDMQTWELTMSFSGETRFRSDPAWWYRFHYHEEQQRGYGHEEDLWTPGVLEVDLGSADSFAVWVTAMRSVMAPLPVDARQSKVAARAIPQRPDDSLSRSALAHETNRCDYAAALAAVEGERTRRLGLMPAGQDPEAPISILVRAADQFLVQRPPDGVTVIAGYPWFTDWGRDSLIALPGLCLVTGRHAEARQILETFAKHRQRGLVPNRFPDGGGVPEYNTADASLWFFVAVYKYLQYTGDASFVQERMLPVLREIVQWHETGTSFGIGVDSDGLLRIGAPGQALTWMDARIDGRPVTPREGKPVEVNALWIDALLLLGDLENLAGNETRGDALQKRARATKREFIRRFWNEATGSLFDVVDGPMGDDASIRPNQIFALSLPLPIVTREHARSILEVCDRELVTRCGLRSLSVHDPHYVARYEGGVAERDGAYHQGTVWSWLVGPYATALSRFGGRAGRRRARAYLEGLLPQVTTLCLGTFPEIFDGEAPHRPRGAVAQAWTVGEWLRAWYEDILEE